MSNATSTMPTRANSRFTAPMTAAQFCSHLGTGARSASGSTGAAATGLPGRLQHAGDRLARGTDGLPDTLEHRTDRAAHEAQLLIGERMVFGAPLAQRLRVAIIL